MDSPEPHFLDKHAINSHREVYDHGVSQEHMAGVVLHVGKFQSAAAQNWQARLAEDDAELTTTLVPTAQETSAIKPPRTTDCVWVGMALSTEKLAAIKREAGTPANQEFAEGAALDGGNPQPASPARTTKRKVGSNSDLVDRMKPADIIAIDPMAKRVVMRKLKGYTFYALSDPDPDTGLSTGSIVSTDSVYFFRAFRDDLAKSHRLRSVASSTKAQEACDRIKASENPVQSAPADEEIVHDDEENVQGDEEEPQGDEEELQGDGSENAEAPGILEIVRNETEQDPPVDEEDYVDVNEQAEVEDDEGERLSVTEMDIGVDIEHHAAVAKFLKSGYMDVAANENNDMDGSRVKRRKSNTHGERSHELEKHHDPIASSGLSKSALLQEDASALSSPSSKHANVISIGDSSSGLSDPDSLEGLRAFSPITEDGDHAELTTTLDATRVFQHVNKLKKAAVRSRGSAGQNLPIRVKEHATANTKQKRNRHEDDGYATDDDNYQQQYTDNVAKQLRNLVGRLQKRGEGAVLHQIHTLAKCLDRADGPAPGSALTVSLNIPDELHVKEYKNMLHELHDFYPLLQDEVREMSHKTFAWMLKGLRMTGTSIKLPLIRAYLVAFNKQMQREIGNEQPHHDELTETKLIDMICAARDHAEALVRHTGTSDLEPGDDADFPYPDKNGQVWAHLPWSTAPKG